jgi:hypothetical protein
MRWRRLAAPRRMRSRGDAEQDESVESVGTEAVGLVVGGGDEALKLRQEHLYADPAKTSELKSDSYFAVSGEKTPLINPAK